MPPFGLVGGGSYTSQSINAECEKTLNFYPEAMESGQGKSPMVLYPTPGLKLFAGIDGARSIRGQLTIDGRLFLVASTQLIECIYHADSGVVETPQRGIVADDRLPVSMTSSPQQLLIASAGMTYVLTLATNAFTPVQIPNNDPQKITKVGYSDSFFNALKADSQQWYISKSFDALTWDPLDTTIISVFTDNAVSSIVDHRKIWFFGQSHTVVYYISGNVFPYDVLDPIIEQGCIAKDSPAQLDNSVFWLGGDERGAGIVWRAQGQTPIRISNHALEFAMQGYPTMTDARSYAYQDQGHSFYHLYFPAANKSWRYDVATNMWCEVDYFDAGTSIAHRSQNHTFIFGKHLVGDWKTASLYEMNILFKDDFGNPIRRVRRAPHISKDNKVLRYIKLEVVLEAGLGTPDIQDFGPPGTPTPAPPTLVTYTLAATQVGATMNYVLTSNFPGFPLTASWSIPVNPVPSLVDPGAAFQLNAPISGLTINGIATPGDFMVFYSVAGGGACGAFQSNILADFNMFGPILYSGGETTPTMLAGNFIINQFETIPGGVIPGLPSIGVTRPPKINMRYSNDYGHTWSNEQTRSAGEGGEYRKRVVFWRMGRARDRVIEINTSDPIFWRLTGDNMEVSPGDGA